MSWIWKCFKIMFKTADLCCFFLLHFSFWEYFIRVFYLKSLRIWNPRFEFSGIKLQIYFSKMIMTLNLYIPSQPFTSVKQINWQNCLLKFNLSIFAFTLLVTFSLLTLCMKAFERFWNLMLIYICIIEREKILLQESVCWLLRLINWCNVIWSNTSLIDVLWVD